MVSMAAHNGHDRTILLTPNLIDGDQFTCFSAKQPIDHLDLGQSDEAAHFISHHTLLTYVAMDHNVASLCHGMKIRKLYYQTTGRRAQKSDSYNKSIESLPPSTMHIVPIKPL